MLLIYSSNTVLVFGHTEYKGKQKEIIEAALERKPEFLSQHSLPDSNSTTGKDIFVLAPTGMGKVC
jgi:superfamily II DNA helicase RecQ